MEGDSVGAAPSPRRAGKASPRGTSYMKLEGPGAPGRRAQAVQGPSWRWGGLGRPGGQRTEGLRRSVSEADW